MYVSIKGCFIVAVANIAATQSRVAATGNRVADAIADADADDDADADAVIALTDADVFAVIPTSLNGCTHFRAAIYLTHDRNIDANGRHRHCRRMMNDRSKK